MGHQKLVRTMAFQHCEIGRTAATATQLKLLPKDPFGMFLGHKTLILDKPSPTVGFLPVRDVVQQKGEGGVGLPIGSPPIQQTA